MMVSSLAMDEILSIGVDRFELTAARQYFERRLRLIRKSVEAPESQSQIYLSLIYVSGDLLLKGPHAKIAISEITL